MIDWLGSVAPKTLALLTKSDDPLIRKRVALYPKTAPNLLEILTMDDHLDIQLAVAKNGQTPESSLFTLFATENLALQTAVLQNPKLTSAALLTLWDGLNSELHPLALSHANFPLEILMQVYPTAKGPLLRAIAQNPKLPASVLSELATNANHYVREQVAKHHSTPPEILAQLTADLNSYVVEAAIKNPNIASSVLESLWITQPQLHVAIAQNVKTPQALLEAALASQDRYLVRATAGNPNVLAHHDLFFAKHQDDTIRLAFAQNPRLPLEYIYYLAADEKAAVRQAVLQHSNLTTSLRELCRYHRTYQLPVHASEAMIRQDFFEALLTLTPKTLVRLIKKMCFEPAMLALLAHHEAYIVRREIARSQQTSQKLLCQLADDPEVPVRQAVAKNPKTQAAILEKLNADVPSVRRSLAENPQIPAYLLEIILRSDDDSIMAMAVANPTITPLELRFHSQSSLPLVRRNVAKNVITPPEILTQLAKDPEACVREYVAKNHQTPLRIIYELTEDVDPIVSRNAIRTYDYWAQSVQLQSKA